MKTEFHLFIPRTILGQEKPKDLSKLTLATVPFSAKAKLAVKSNSPINIVKIYHGKKILTNLFFIKFLNFSKQI